MSGSSRDADVGIWTLSNAITITRILLVPAFVAALLAPWPEWFGMSAAASNDWKSIVAAGIFILISCTDWLDGYLARSRGEVTDFGKFMDPLADKILVAAALIALVELGSLPTWVVLVILAREFIVSGVRMMAASKGVVIAASMIGKFKTVFQMIAIVLFVVKDSHMIGSFGDALADVLWDVSWIVMLIAVGLTVASMVDYLVKARDVLGLGAQGARETGAIAQRGDGEDSRSATASVENGDVESLTRLLVQTAGARNVTVSCAESLTGGMIGESITAVAGSSSVFRGGVMSYTNDVKHAVLGVDAAVLEREGAVCERVACEMARGVRELLDSDISVSVTGIAGPGGAEPGKPVGTVFIGASGPRGTYAKRFQFDGSREGVRAQTTAEALQTLISLLD